MVPMSGGDDCVKEFNTEIWYAGAGVEIDSKRNESTESVASLGVANDSIVRWEKFLPKMMLRVLLVESDDSTRQIIAALLRKCSYRVSAISDGLKAWEVLKRRAQNFDLILTEVDLPSISGFALLTLVTEHTVCKNIPVIMMSSQDSVNTVYKCMLRGAADFLVKPVRKNELKNLWQHVWRRQASSSSGIGPPEESVGQQTLEATAENNATSKCSNDDMACIKRSREIVEEGSEEQSSCTKPESEPEGTQLDFVQNPPYSKRSKTSSAKGLLPNSGHINLIKEVEDYHVRDEGSTVATDIVTNQDIQQDTKLDDASKQACGDNNNAVIRSTREAIDLIGAFDKHLTCINRNSNSYDRRNKFDSLPFLDLSLKRSLPCGLTNQVTQERCSLNHSDASAFSRYVSKTQCPGHYSASSPTPCNQLGNQEAISDKPNINADPFELSILPPRSTPLNSDHQPEKTENQFPVTKLSFQNTPEFNIENGDPDDVNGPCENYIEKQGDNISYVTTNQSENTGFCNVNRHNLTLESIAELESVSNKHESGIDEAFRVHVEGSLRSPIQREAALMRFRLKRKERCFEKKVRYENRKKLAEKRPRVKGQFVCQLSKLPPAKSSLI